MQTNTLDNDLLDMVAKKILSVVQPEKIILFGSFARGEAKEGSDLDIMVIMDSDQPRYKRSVPIRLALKGLLPSKDIVVYTPQEVEEWASASTSLVATVLREGLVLYEKGK